MRSPKQPGASANANLNHIFNTHLPRGQYADSELGDEDDLDRHRPRKLDIYSIPVFFLELFVLALLALSAYFVHNLYFLEPLVTGFYCDDRAYRHVFKEAGLAKFLVKELDELIVLALLTVIPMFFIIFCELINSILGSIRFRRVKALCKCCTLHSITRRAVRFSGAHLLGLFIVIISCEILSSSTGHLRPYFELKCPQAYESCLSHASPRLNSKPISSNSYNGTLEPVPVPSTMANESLNASLEQAPHNRLRRDSQPFVQERQWVDLATLGPNLSSICSFDEQSSSEGELFKFHQLAKSWPSYPAAIFTYSCLFVATYLSFAGTARPVRMITCVMVLALMVVATMFNVQLVKEHFNHRADVLAGAALALLVDVFVTIVYLNLFRDTHYYERQKMISGQRMEVRETFGPFTASPINSGNDTFTINDETIRSTDGIVDDTPTPRSNSTYIASGNPQGSDMDTSGIHMAPAANDFSMRYFKIPRANYLNKNY